MSNTKLPAADPQPCAPAGETETSSADKPKGGAGNFRNDPYRAARAGRKGGQASGGNFKHDRERAAQAGRKGGQSRSSKRDLAET